MRPTECWKNAVLFLKYLFYKAPEISFDAFVAIFVFGFQICVVIPVSYLSMTLNTIVVYYGWHEANI